MKNNVVKNKSLNDLKKKYAYSYKNGKIIYFTEKEVEDFKKKYGSYEYDGKIYKLNEDDSSLLNKKRTYYHIDNKFYLIPSTKKVRNISLFTILGCAVVASGTVGGLHLYNKINKVGTTIEGEQEVIEKTEVEVTKPAEVGQEYKATIKLKEDVKKEEQSFIPAKLTKVTTGGIELSEWHKTTTELKLVKNDEEPENYYTYTLNEDRTSGDLYIKKVLGPVVISFELSHTKEVKITSEPTTTNYFVGETFSKDGLEVKYVKPNGEEGIADLSKCKLSIEDGYKFQKSDISDKTQVEVIYDNCATSFNISVKASEVVSIEVETNPSRTTFLVGERFDSTGIKVNAIDAQGEKEDVTSLVKYSMGENDKFSQDDIASGKTITVSYAAKSTTINVAVKMPVALNIKSMPNKTVYALNDKLTLQNILSGVKLGGSIPGEGLFSGQLDLNDCTFTCEDENVTLDSEIEFNKIGALKEIKIKFHDLPVKSIYVSCPVTCNDQAELETNYSNAEYNAFLLKKNDNSYRIVNNRITSPITSDPRVMFIGETIDGETTVFDYKAGDESFRNYSFSGMNIMFDNIIIDCVNPTPLEPSAMDNYPGLIGYDSAIYNNVTFNTMMVWFGRSSSSYEGENQKYLSTFYNCTFNGKTGDYENYILWTYSGTFEFYNTTFNAFSRCINFDRGGGSFNLYPVLFESCTFNVTKTRTEWIEEYGHEIAKGLFSIKENLFTVLINANNCNFTDCLTTKDYDLITDKKDSKYYPSTSPEVGSAVYLNGFKQTWGDPKQM